jgi:hypothetical protein
MSTVARQRMPAGCCRELYLAFNRADQTSPTAFAGCIRSEVPAMAEDQGLSGSEARQARVRRRAASSDSVCTHTCCQQAAATGQPASGDPSTATVFTRAMPQAGAALQAGLAIFVRPRAEGSQSVA